MLIESVGARLSAAKYRQKLQTYIINREYVLLLGLTLFGLGLRLHQVSAWSLWGDEYNSLRETAEIGLNLNSLPYFLLLRLVLILGGGDSEFWLRLPAVIFGTLTTPVVYFLGKDLFASRAHGFLVAVLSLTSAYLIEYGQLVRFYTFFLFTSALAFLAFVRYVRYEYSHRSLILLITAGLLCIASHALGFLVPLIQIITYWLIKGSRLKTKFVMLSTGLILILGLPYLLPAHWLEYPFLFLDRYQAGYAGLASYNGPRGLSLATMVKIPMMFFFFAFGQSVYPLTLWLIIPGTLLYGYLSLAGLWKLRSYRLAFVLVLVWLGVSPLLLFIGFDSWVVDGFVGASPQHAIHVILALQLVVAHGLLNHRRRALLLVILLLGINLIALNFYYNPVWSYTSRLVNWRDAAAFSQNLAGEKTLLLHDGRSTNSIDYYFPDSIQTEGIWSYGTERPLSELADFDRLILVSFDFNPERRHTFTEVLQNIEKEFVFEDGYVDYPLFVYVYHRSKMRSGGVVDLDLPKQIFDLSFADLKLPQQADFDQTEFTLFGTFSIPTLTGKPEHIIGVDSTVPAKKLVLLSNLTQAENLPFGEAVAEILIETTDGESHRILLRKGIETNHWLTPCPAADQKTMSCRVAYTWHKLAAIVGRRAYDGAWRDSNANIFGASIEFNKPIVPRNTRIRYLASKGTLHIWGMRFVGMAE